MTSQGNKVKYGSTEDAEQGKPLVAVQQQQQVVVDHSVTAFEKMKHSGSDMSHSSKLSQSVRSFVNASFKLGGENQSIRMFVGKASIPNEIFNLIKNLVGAGAFSFPAGVGAYSNSLSGLYPAAVITCIMGVVFAYYFLLMGRICQMTTTSSYREAWENTMGQSVAAVVPLFIILMAGLGNLAYNMILADTVKSLLELAGIEVSRTISLIAVTWLFLFPLCLVKQLSVLAPFSFVGMVGMIFTVIAMGIRYYDGSYAEPDGHFLKELPEKYQPDLGTIGAAGAISGKFLVFVCMTFQAFFAHYNAPRYYMELKNPTVPRFTMVVGPSFFISGVLFLVLTYFGFMTFGGSSDGYILNNYANNDRMLSFCRFAVAIALAFTYPLPFIGVRDGILDLLMVPPEKHTVWNLNVLTVLLLIVFTVLAWLFTDVGIVQAVGGGALGTAVVFIFPALMFRNAVRNLGTSATPSLQHEATIAIILMWCGIVMGAIGVVVALTGI